MSWISITLLAHYKLFLVYWKMPCLWDKFYKSFNENSAYPLFYDFSIEKYLDQTAIYIYHLWYYSLHTLTNNLDKTQTHDHNAR